MHACFYKAKIRYLPCRQVGLEASADRSSRRAETGLAFEIDGLRIHVNMIHTT